MNCIGQLYNIINLNLKVHYYLLILFHKFVDFLHFIFFTNKSLFESDFVRLQVLFNLYCCSSKLNYLVLCYFLIFIKFLHLSFSFLFKPISLIIWSWENILLLFKFQFLSILIFLILIFFTNFLFSLNSFLF